MSPAIHNNARLYAKLDIDEELDDAGLSCSAFRIYVHLSHVCSKETVDMPPITRIATKVRMNRETVIKAIRELEARGFIRVDRSWGEKADYHVNPKHCWVPVPKTDQYLKPASRKEVLVPKIKPTSTYNRLVPEPPSSPSPLVSPSSPLASPSPSPLTPQTPSSTLPENAGDLTLTSETPKKDKRRTSCFEELERHVVRNLGLTTEDAYWLWDKWEGNGWKVDGKSMACWRSTASSWARTKRSFPSQNKEGKGNRFSGSKTGIVSTS